MKANTVSQEIPIVIYVDQKPVLIFANGQIGGLYIAKEGNIRKKHLTVYAKQRGNILAKSNRYDKKIAVRYAKEEHIKQLGTNRILVLDEKFRNTAHKEKSIFTGSGFDSNKGRSRENKIEEVIIAVKSVKDWQTKSIAELRKITGKPAVLISEVFNKEFINQRSYKHDYIMRKHSLRGTMNTALKYIDKIDVIKIMRELIDELKEIDGQ